ncbi:MAG: hypothetical protein M3220_17200 [Chloroflexota bacterium]|nr:hypothetical protein [Chloroflexota bacterium]
MEQDELGCIEQGCRDAVDCLLARHDWHLLEREEFVCRSLEHLQGGIASDPYRAATYTYSQAMHRACSGIEGEQRQEQAYSELFRYLYDSASRRYGDLGAEVTQQALARIFMTFDRCRAPGTFFAWAFQQLRDAARAQRSQVIPEAQSLEAQPGADDEMMLGERLSDPSQRDPLEQVLVAEQRSRLDHMVAEFLRTHPRAAQQLAALLLKHHEGLDDHTISQRLGKPVESIYVLRSRAMRKLQQEPSWQALAAELGALPKPITTPTIPINQETRNMWRYDEAELEGLVEQSL